MAIDQAPPLTIAAPVEAPPSHLDAFMRRLLRIPSVQPEAAAGAHRSFRISLLISAVRCLIVYILLPVVAPAVSFLAQVAAPISIAFCVLGLVTGFISVRRFWLADHRTKWKYTIFMGVVYVLLLVGIAFDIKTLVTA